MKKGLVMAFVSTCAHWCLAEYPKIEIVVGTNECQGILYEYGTNVQYESGYVWHCGGCALPLRYVADEVRYDGAITITNATDSYAIAWGEFPLRYIKGHAKILNVPSWVCRSDCYYFDGEEEFWEYYDTDTLVGITNVDMIVIRDSKVGINSWGQNCYGFYFLTASTFRTIVVGEGVPMARIDGEYLHLGEVSLKMIQEILFHAKEFYYPSQYSNSWESAIRKLSFDGKYGAYSGETFSRDNIVPNSGNLKPVELPVVTNYVYSTVTNEIHHYLTVTNEIFHYTTVTNVVKYVPEPGASPDAGYGINVGAGGETVIAGAAGWDAFGVPDGMEWNKETGTLSGGAKLSGAYDLILVSGSGADTKIMRTTLTVAPYDTIIGYVGVAFSQSGAPLDNLKSYKTLPAGLKWVSGGRGATALPGVLQGVPTKAQTLDLETADGEPVKIEIKALPDSVVGTFDGCVYFPPSDPTNGVANTCDIGGTITLTATAAGKISASVKTAKKTYSFSMASWAKFAEGDAFTLEAGAELKTGETLEVNATVRDGATMVLAELSGGEFGGPRGTALAKGEDDGHAGRVTLPGCVTMLVKDVYAKSGSKWIDEDAHALMVKCAGTYQFGFDAVESGGVIDTALPAWTMRPVAKIEAAFLKVVLKDTGVATITGTLPDKTKINLSAKATASAVDGSDKVEIKIVSAAFSGKTTTLPVEVNLINDGSFAEGRANCGIIYSVKR